MGQVVSLEEMTRIRQTMREQGRRLVLTNGCFDLLHRGHVIYLQAARAHGDALVVGLNSDASVRAIKGSGRPLATQDDRAIVLAALAAVDYVVIFDAGTAQDLVRVLQPDVYVKGGDYDCAGAMHAPGQEPAPTGKPLPEAPVVQSYGGTVVILPYLPGYSTSALIDTILARTLIPGNQAP
ncbi:MAG: adenylyltransferase/cytidyltransferase family protein [Chloroflexi bacterium]|nr:adenylyltransferase/cytidyltransferase family protein [Chloroflexota bacterium]MBU1746771.1 adenylyltransferase/cytidyltransferase family protein [Chloroflexota bacterium]MBU1878621.1 adenylyltransferase/cytidyltransferase family protein [Chloroflexota bacterium]